MPLPQNQVRHGWVRTQSRDLWWTLQAFWEHILFLIYALRFFFKYFASHLCLFVVYRLSPAHRLSWMFPAWFLCMFHHLEHSLSTIAILLKISLLWIYLCLFIKDFAGILCIFPFRWNAYYQTELFRLPNFTDEIMYKSILYHPHVYYLVIFRSNHI